MCKRFGNRDYGIDTEQGKKEYSGDGAFNSAHNTDGYIFDAVCALSWVWVIDMKAFKIISKIFCGIVVFIFVAIIAFYLISAVANDFTAKAVVNEIKEIPLPENTEIIDEISVAGKLVGNGNGMQYFGAIWIKSELELWQLDDYYADYRKGEFDFIVQEQAGQEINIIEHGNYAFKKERPQGRCYIVYSWGSGDGFFEYFDLRGH